MATQIQLRRGTASAWTSANPVLAQGEMGLETDTGKFKVGNGTSNWSSLVYASGLQGPQGFQGTTGPQGTQGVQGPAASLAAGTVTIVAAGSAASVTNSGTSSAAVFDFTLPRGDQGVQGAQGFQGPQGSQGSQGFQGAVGPQGSQGTQGVQGAVGLQGPQGNQGAVGPQGNQGAQGAIGAQGPQGVQGSTGSQGPQGFQGAVGAQGSQGAVGSQGAAGAQGAVGPQGTQGFQGDVGAQGAVGSQGAAGAQGVAGAQGSAGPQGAAGSQGAAGAQGSQGSQGVGVATGGTTNQFLVKNSGTNFDTAWSSALTADSVTMTSGGSKTVTTAGTELVLQQTGDVYGASYLKLRNRYGSGGALFAAPTGSGLVDFGFEPGLLYQSNIRLEARPNTFGTIKVGPTPTTVTEFQLIDNSTNVGGTGVTFYFCSNKNATVVRTGVFGVGVDNPSAQVHFVAASASTVGEIVQGAASQTADLSQWQNSSGTVLARVTSSGRFISTQSSGDDDQMILAMQVFS